MLIKKIKIGNWNAHSVVKKKTEVESLLSIYDLDLLAVSETWLTRQVVDWSVFGFYSYRCDRPGPNVGGGAMILAKRNLIITPIDLNGRYKEFFDVVAIVLQTETGDMGFVSVYAPPGIDIPPVCWLELMQDLNFCSSLIVCGDFNAHSMSWGACSDSPRGLHILDAMDTFNLVNLNDSVPTHEDFSGRSRNNLDLVLVSANLSCLSSAEVTEDSFGSDHLLVKVVIDASPKYVKSLNKRLKLTKVNWGKFAVEISESASELHSRLETGAEPVLVYDEFVDRIKTNLTENGAYYPSDFNGKRKSQPLWWDDECVEILKKRTQARKEFLLIQDNASRENYRLIDNEVKKSLRRKKSLSFKQFCENIDPSMSLSKVWRTVRSFSNRNSPLSSNICNDPNSEIFKTLQEDLVKPNILAFELPIKKK